MPKKIKPSLLVKIQADYELGIKNKTQICKDYKITHPTLDNYIKKNNWIEHKQHQDYVKAKELTLTKEIEASLNKKDTQILERLATTAAENVIKQNEYNITLAELKRKNLLQINLGNNCITDAFTKPKVSKTIVITSKDKNGNITGEKIINETRELDGHEKAALKRTAIEEFKAFNPEEENPSVVINNNQQQMQVNTDDIEKLSKLVLDKNIQDIQKEN